MGSYLACAAVVATCSCGRREFATLTDGANDSFEPVVPVAAYSLNEGGGQTVSNSIAGGSSVNGVLGNGVSNEVLDPSWVQGRFGTALDFDATDDRVSIPYAPSGPFQTSVTNDAITISAWVEPMLPGASYRVVYQIGGESNGATVGLVDTGQVRFVMRNLNAVQVSKVLDSSMSLGLGAWYYVAGTSDASGMNLSIYDESGARLEHASASGPYTWRTGGDGIAIGDNAAGNSGLRGVLLTGPEPFDGVIDEVRVYLVAISEAQIEADLGTALP